MMPICSDFTLFFAVITSRRAVFIRSLGILKVISTIRRIES